jgi:hypothetical protein
MSDTDYKTIPVDAELFAELEQLKGDTFTWSGLISMLYQTADTETLQEIRRYSSRGWVRDDGN